MEKASAKKVSKQSSYTITLDDDPMIVRLIEKIVGVKSLPFSSIQGLLGQAEKLSPMAAFIDIHLQLSETGLETLPRLRKYWPSCPLFVITSDPSSQVISEALAKGADDFIRKPLQSEELMARLQIRLEEKAKRWEKETIPIGDLTLDRVRRHLIGEGGECYLPPSLTNLLIVLIEAKGVVVTRQFLLHRIWGDIKISNNALDRKLHELRTLLKETSQNVSLKTIYGKGVVLQVKPR